MNNGDIMEFPMIRRKKSRKQICKEYMVMKMRNIYIELLGYS